MKSDVYSFVVFVLYIFIGKKLFEGTFVFWLSDVIFNNNVRFKLFFYCFEELVFII